LLFNECLLFVRVYFVIYSVRKLLVTPSYVRTVLNLVIFSLSMWNFAVKHLISKLLT